MSDKIVYSGRKKIYTDYTDLNDSNVMEFLNEVITFHHTNVSQIGYLYRYYRGVQPVLDRTKTVRPEICNKIVENRAQEIVNFNTGYIGGEPIQYISRSEKDISKKINLLNSMMECESKASKDKELIEWDMICGTAFKMALPDEMGGFKIYVPDPRRTFVVYSSTIGEEPFAGVFVTKKRDGTNIYDIYTKNHYFMVDDQKLVKSQPHIMGMVPIIEYPANKARMGSFEAVLPLLDAINALDSNRLDGVEQFIQSLLILYNCQLPDGATATTIRENGIIELKQIGDAKADIKELVEQLNQTETQTLKDDLYQSILTIVGMPAQGGANMSDSSNNGAVMLRNGWQGAETRAKAYELSFKKSEREFLKLIMALVPSIGLDVKDIDYKFTRRAYEDLLAKAQVLTTMLGTNKIHPSLAFNACGLFIDPEEACMRSMKWMEEQEAKTEERMRKQMEMTDEQNSAEDRRTEPADGRDAGKRNGSQESN